MSTPKLRALGYAHRPGQLTFMTAYAIYQAGVSCDGCQVALGFDMRCSLGASPRYPSIGRRLVFCHTCRPWHLRTPPPPDCNWCLGIRTQHRRKRGPGSGPIRADTLRAWAFTALGRALLTHGCEDDPGCINWGNPTSRCLLYNALAELVAS